MVPLFQIRAYAKRIAAEFKTRRIILFGSHAYGTPNENSDVDLMVVMGRSQDMMSNAIAIRLKLDAPFPVDVLVRSEAEMRRRYETEDWFIREVIDKGIVLHETGDSGVDNKGRGRPTIRRVPRCKEEERSLAK